MGTAPVSPRSLIDHTHQAFATNDAAQLAARGLSPDEFAQLKREFGSLSHADRQRFLNGMRDEVAISPELADFTAVLSRKDGPGTYDDFLELRERPGRDAAAGFIASFEAKWNNAAGAVPLEPTDVAQLRLDMIGRYKALQPEQRQAFTSAVGTFLESRKTAVVALRELTSNLPAAVAFEEITALYKAAQKPGAAGLLVVSEASFTKLAAEIKQRRDELRSLPGRQGAELMAQVSRFADHEARALAKVPTDKLDDAGKRDKLTLERGLRYLDDPDFYAAKLAGR